MPAVTIAERGAPEEATPNTRLAVDTIPSLAPSTDARSQPALPPRWVSRCAVTTGVAARQAGRPARGREGGEGTGGSSSSARSRR